MQYNDIKEIIEYLDRLPRTHQFTGLTIVSGLSYISVDLEGNLSLIIKTNDRVRYNFSTDVLKLKLSSHCQLITESQKIEDWFHVLSCHTNDNDLKMMFALLCNAIGSQVTSEKNSDEIIVFFNSVAQLFKTTPATNLSRERQGLWGELFLIKQLGNMPKYINHWHSDPFRKFDLSYDKFRLEVKTTTKKERIHSFSHDQIFREDDIEIVVASILLQEEDAGIPLQQLINEIRIEINKDVNLLLKLEKAVKTAGMDNPNEIGPIYDYGYAESNLHWYDSKVIPKFNLSEPKGVSGTRYRIDISTSPNMDLGELNNWLDKWS